MPLIHRLAIFLVSFLILTRFNFDPDLGWHLAYGQRFLATGEIIRSDPFSWTMPGYTWGNSYFAYQIIVAFLYDKLDYRIVTIIFGAIASIGILLLLPKKINLWTFLVAGLGSAMSLANLAVRPHVFDFLLFPILLIFLRKKMFRRKSFIIFWLLFFAVWANLHVGFLVGLLVLVAFVMVDYLQKFSSVRKSFDWAGICCVISAILGTFLTPFHFKMWGSIILHSGGPTAWQSIAEYLPAPIFFPIDFLYLVSGVVFIYIFLKKMKTVDLVWFLVAALLFILPFLSVFYILFWVEIFIFITARYLRMNFDFRKKTFAKLPIILAIVAVTCTFVLNFAVPFLESYNFRNFLRKNDYPVDALEFLKNEKLTGNLFNEYGWGGFIDWQMPGQKVFIDGRMAGWRRKDGREILSDYLEIIKGNCDVFKSYDIRVILVKKDANVGCFGDFKKVYEDSVAKVLVR